VVTVELALFHDRRHRAIELGAVLKSGSSRRAASIASGPPYARVIHHEDPQRSSLRDRKETQIHERLSCMVPARNESGLFGFEHDNAARIAARNNNAWRVTDAARGQTGCSLCVSVLH
jgi:hypothetical protein